MPYRDDQRLFGSERQGGYVTMPKASQSSSGIMCKASVSMCTSAVVSNSSGVANKTGIVADFLRKRKVLAKDIKWVIVTGSGHDSVKAELLGYVDKTLDEVNPNPAQFETANGRI